MITRALTRLRQDWFSVLCLTIVVLVVLTGFFASWIAPNDPVETAIRQKYLAPSTAFPFGTDHLGRCVFSRIVFGIQTTVFYAILAMALTLLLGSLIGLIAGVCGRKVDEFLMRLCDVMLSFPGEVMILALVGVLGPGLGNILLAIVVVKWAWYARMVRSAVMQYTQTNYVRYARVIGAPSSHILKRHLLPMTAAEIALLATTDIGAVILMISALSFLGLGVQAPTPEWGSMLSEAKNVMVLHPELMLPAGLAIVVVVVAFNGLGDFARDVLDHSDRQAHDRQKRLSNPTEDRF